MEYSLHVCVERPEDERIEEMGPDAGWLDVVWPEQLEFEDAWFGSEESCGHGYCARIDFDNDCPEETMRRLCQIPQIIAVKEE